MNTVLIYGSTYGTCTDISQRMVAILKEVDLFEVSAFDFSTLKNYDKIILGTSTWGAGILQQEWEKNIESLKSVDLSGKKVAIFGTGDQEGYPETFAEAIKDLNDIVLGCGASVVGQWPIEGYEYESSRAVIDGKFVGLVIDEENQDELTDSRIEEWLLDIAF